MKHRAILLSLAASLLSACQSLEPAPEPQQHATAAPTTSIASLYQQPAERLLVDGIRLYEEAAFTRAETALRQALDDGLADRRDQAVAYKYIAFISCAFNRLAECEASFERAFAVDPGFSLSDKEIGHPVWGPIYRQLAATRAR
jgi:tetratricopeptide (TPR) repeat protein